MKKITDLNVRLLEGCVWDEKKQVLYFVDIECRQIYRYLRARSGNNLKYIDKNGYKRII